MKKTCLFTWITAMAVVPFVYAGAPTITCSEDQVLVSPDTNIVQAVVSATIQDLEGDALRVEWAINGQLASSSDLAAGETNAVMFYLTNDFEYGTNTVEVRVTSDLNTNFVNWVSCSSQVIVTPTSVPTVVCSESQELDCIESSMVGIVAATIYEPDGSALQGEWFVNGQSFSTFEIEADGATNPVTLYLTNTYPVGTNLVSLVVSDSESNEVECVTQIIMKDTHAPVIKKLTASKEVLWPANHKFVCVSLSLQAEDCSPVKWRILRILSNERCVVGAGHTYRDTYISGAHQCLLRAERSGKGSGRVYTIIVEVKDTSGNCTIEKVYVRVPHDMSSKAKSVKPAGKAAPVVKESPATKAQGNGKAASPAQANPSNKGGKKK